jgi:hypothetical protein
MPQWNQGAEGEGPSAVKQILFQAVREIPNVEARIYVIPATGGHWTLISKSQPWDDKPRLMERRFISFRPGVAYSMSGGIRFDPTNGQPVGEAFDLRFILHLQVVSHFGFLNREEIASQDHRHPLKRIAMPQHDLAGSRQRLQLFSKQLVIRSSHNRNLQRARVLAIVVERNVRYGGIFPRFSFDPSSAVVIFFQVD